MKPAIWHTRPQIQYFNIKGIYCSAFLFSETPRLYINKFATGNQSVFCYTDSPEEVVGTNLAAFSFRIFDIPHSQVTEPTSNESTMNSVLHVHRIECFIVVQCAQALLTCFAHFSLTFRIPWKLEQKVRFPRLLEQLAARQPFTIALSVNLHWCSCGNILYCQPTFDHNRM